MLLGRNTPLEPVGSQPEGLCICGCGKRCLKKFAKGHYKRDTGPLAEEKDYGYITSCWIWTGWKNKTGYGGISIDGKQWLAHRWVYKEMIGDLPDNLSIDHLCLNHDCVNPSHLEVVTLVVNSERQWKSGLGVESPLASLNRVKTHCPRGHLYNEQNTFIRRGRRECRECIRIRSRLQRRVNDAYT